MRALSIIVVMFSLLAGFALAIKTSREAPSAYSNTFPALLEPSGGQYAIEDIPEATALPEFSFVALDGKKYDRNDFKNKIVIVNFWATWCAPCVKEFPALLEIAAKNPDKVSLIALSSDLDQESINTFLRKLENDGHKWDLSNVFVSLDRDDITHRVFNISKLPETLVTGRDLTARHKLVGADWNAQDLQKILNSL